MSRVASNDPAPWSIVTSLGSVGSTGSHASPHGRSTVAISRAISGRNTRSPAAGTPIATLRTQPKPSACSTIAGSPSIHRARTCTPTPPSRRHTRGNAATTAPAVGRNTTTAPTVSTGWRGVHGSVRPTAGHTTSTRSCPLRVHAESAAVAWSRTSRTSVVSAAPLVPRSPCAATGPATRSGSSLAPRTVIVEGVTESRAAITGTTRIRPPHRARTAGVLASISSPASGETRSSSSESARSCQSDAVRRATISALDTEPRPPRRWSDMTVSMACADGTRCAVESKTTSTSPSRSSRRTLSRTDPMSATSRERSATTMRTTGDRWGARCGRANAAPTSAITATRTSSNSRSSGLRAAVTIVADVAGMNRAVGSEADGGCRVTTKCSATVSPAIAAAARRKPGARNVMGPTTRPSARRSRDRVIRTRSGGRREPASRLRTR